MPYRNICSHKPTQTNINDFHFTTSTIWCYSSCRWSLSISVWTRECMLLGCSIWGRNGGHHYVTSQFLSHVLKNLGRHGYEASMMCNTSVCLVALLLLILCELLHEKAPLVIFHQCWVKFDFSLLSCYYSNCVYQASYFWILTCYVCTCIWWMPGLIFRLSLNLFLTLTHACKSLQYIRLKLVGGPIFEVSVLSWAYVHVHV